jgi:nucleoside-diphosphate-sugar epimerase
MAKAGQDEKLFLFARRPAVVDAWLHANALTGRFPVADYAAFGAGDYDAIVNFVGVGDPARAEMMGSAIFDLTLQYDGLVLDYLRDKPHCRYLFLSSGAAYGGTFDEPIQHTSKASVNLNNLSRQEWYGVAKLHAECRHRSLADRPIIDIRVFNYFSRTQDLAARFLLRDYLHPADFHNLVRALLSSPQTNAAVDCYSLAPIDKPTLLGEMQREFGLRYEITEAPIALNATGAKPYYYSLNHRAADFGYLPTRTSLAGISEETRAMLECLQAPK